MRFINTPAFRLRRWARRIFDRLRGVKLTTTGDALHVTRTGMYEVSTSMLLSVNGSAVRQTWTERHVAYLHEGDEIRPAAQTIGAWLPSVDPKGDVIYG